MKKIFQILLLAAGGIALMAAPYYGRFDDAYKAGKRLRREGRYSEALEAFARARKLAKNAKEREKAGDGMESVRSKTLESVLARYKAEVADDPKAWLEIKPKLEEQLKSEKLSASQKVQVLDAIFDIAEKYCKSLRIQAQMEIGDEDADPDKAMAQANAASLEVQEQLADYSMQALEIPNLSGKEKRQILMLLYSLSFSGTPRNLDRILAVTEAEKGNAISREEKEKALGFLITLYFRQKNDEKTILYGEHYLKHVGRPGWLMYDVLVSHYRLQHYEQSAAMAERLLVMQSRTFEKNFSEYRQAVAINILLKSYLELEKYQKVITAGSKYADQLFSRTQHETCCETMFQAAVKGKMPEQAAAIAAERLKEHEEDPVLQLKWRIRYAQYLTEQKKYEDAVKQLSAVLDSEEYSPQQKAPALALLQRIKQENGDKENLKAVQRNKQEYTGDDQAGVAVAKAAYFLSKGERDQAVKCAEEGLVTQGDEDARFGCVNILLRTKYSSDKDAAAFLEKTRQEGHFSEPYQAALVILSIPKYFGQKEYEKVIERFPEAAPQLQQTPKWKKLVASVTPLYLQSLHNLKRYHEVLSEGEKLLQADFPDYTQLAILEKMGKAALALHEYQLALDLSEKMRPLTQKTKSRISPEEIAMWAAFSRGDFAAAESSASMLLKNSRVSSQHSGAWMLLCKSAEKQGKTPEERLAILDRALQDEVLCKNSRYKVRFLNQKGELLLQQRDKGKLAELLPQLAPYKEHGSIPKSERNKISALENAFQQL